MGGKTPRTTAPTKHGSAVCNVSLPPCSGTVPTKHGHGVFVHPCPAAAKTFYISEGETVSGVPVELSGQQIGIFFRKNAAYL